MYRIQDLPSDERPRERLRAQGDEALSNCELLALINSTGAQGVSALDLSRNILKHFDNSLLRLSRATLDELCEIHGIGEAKASSIRAVFSLARRLQGQQGLERFLGTAPESAVEYMRPVLMGKDGSNIDALYDFMEWHIHYVGRGGIASFAISAIAVTPPASIWARNIKAS